MPQSIKQNWTGNNFSIDDESIPEEFRICPFRIANTIDSKDIPFSLKRDSEGCFFTCRFYTELNVQDI